MKDQNDKTVKPQDILMGLLQVEGAISTLVSQLASIERAQNATGNLQQRDKLTRIFKGVAAKETSGLRPVGRPVGKSASPQDILAACTDRYWLDKQAFWRLLPKDISRRQTLATLERLKTEGKVITRKGRGGWIKLAQEMR
jgi:hypothetical protein